MELNVYDAIQRLRPSWLRGRVGSAPVVLVDGTSQGGDLRTLRSYRVRDIEEIEYMSASDATNRYGTGYGSGVILLTTRR